MDSGEFQRVTILVSDEKELLVLFSSFSVLTDSDLMSHSHELLLGSWAFSGSCIDVVGSSDPLQERRLPVWVSPSGAGEVSSCLPVRRIWAGEVSPCSSLDCRGLHAAQYCQVGS